MRSAFVSLGLAMIVLFGLVYLAGRVFAVGIRHERRSQDRRDRGGLMGDPAPNAGAQPVRHGDPGARRPAPPAQPDGETDH